MLWKKKRPVLAEVWEFAKIDIMLCVSIHVCVCVHLCA